MPCSCDGEKRERERGEERKIYIPRIKCLLPVTLSMSVSVQKKLFKLDDKNDRCVVSRAIA